MGTFIADSTSSSFLWIFENLNGLNHQALGHTLYLHELSKNLTFSDLRCRRGCISCILPVVMLIPNAPSFENIVSFVPLCE